MRVIPAMIAGVVASGLFVGAAGAVPIVDISESSGAVGGQVVLTYTLTSDVAMTLGGFNVQATKPDSGTSFSFPNSGAAASSPNGASFGPSFGLGGPNDPVGTQVNFTAFANGSEAVIPAGVPITLGTLTLNVTASATPGSSYPLQVSFAEIDGTVGGNAVEWKTPTAVTATGGSITVTPEPTCLGVAGLAAAGLLARRRRQV